MSTQFEKHNKLILFFTLCTLLPEKGGVKEVKKRERTEQESNRAKIFITPGYSYQPPPSSAVTQALCWIQKQ